jgi:hypothetical protein
MVMESLLSKSRCDHPWGMPKFIFEEMDAGSEV